MNLPPPDGYIEVRDSFDSQWKVGSVPAYTEATVRKIVNDVLEYAALTCEPRPLDNAANAYEAEIFMARQDAARAIRKLKEKG